jgi:oligopeptidase B
MNDARVPYWQPAKYVAKLRALRTGDRPILLQVDPVGGHFLASGRRAGIRETARQYAFLLTQLHVGE